MLGRQSLGAGLITLVTLFGGTPLSLAQTKDAGTTGAGPSIGMLPGVGSTPAGIILATPVQASPGESRTSSGPIVPIQYQVPGPAPDGVLEPASQPELLVSSEGEVVPVAKWGPTPPEDIGLLAHSRFGDILNYNGIRVYGWLDQGYTFSSTGPGLLSVETRENRYGNEYLLDQMAVVVEKPLNEEQLSFGYNATFYAGADAALLQPEGGFTTTNTHFGADFYQLFVSAHLPVLSDGGIDIKAGRQASILGYESALAPYRPFYSSSYQWFYSQDQAFTGLLTDWHVSKQLDILNGITFGANTFFTLRGDGPCYLGQVNYWLQEEKQTKLSASILAGPRAILAAPGFTGSFVTVFEMRVEHEWSKCLTQIVQSDMGWENSTPGVGTSQWYSLYSMWILHVGPHIDANARVEWFDDCDGSRTGFSASYEEITLGLDYHPTPCLSLRPEIRGDFAGTSAYGNGSNAAQLTLAIDALLKF